MNGNRSITSGSRKGYSGPSLHGGIDGDLKCIEFKADFRQASHTNEKKKKKKKDYRLLIKTHL